MNGDLEQVEPEVALALQKPRFFHETVLILSGVVFSVIALGIYYYGVHGRALTAGLDQACAEAAFKSGKDFEGMGNYEQALQRYRQAMEGHFSDPERRYMCGRSIGDLLMKQQRYSEAVAAYEQLPPEAFSAAGSYTGYVTALWRNRQLAQAEEQGKIWLRLAQEQQDRQQQIWANNTLLHLAMETHRGEDVLAYGQALIALEPGAEARLVMARVLCDRGAFQEALDQVEAFLAHNTNERLQKDAQALKDRITQRFQKQ